jgi:protein-S-isoprenylcysteine O-methyltransferase Ste14
MTSIDTKVPAPLAGVITFGAMKLYAHATNVTGDESGLRVAVFLGFTYASAFLALAAFATFWRVRTTINPFDPRRASTLVTHGIFRLTRNPMYLSLLLLLVGYAVRMGGQLEFLGPIVFYLYVTRFQILPEELALQARFGDTYLAYKQRTRRWI